jgi:hypothetical protein
MTIALLGRLRCRKISISLPLRSRIEFVAKLGTVVEEGDETVFWFELLSEANIVSGPELVGVTDEARQALAIVAASQLTVKRSLQIKS